MALSYADVKRGIEERLMDAPLMQLAEIYNTLHGTNLAPVATESGDIIFEDEA